MADNISIRDGNGTVLTMRTTDTTGADLHVPVHRLDTLPISGVAGLSVVNTDLLTNVVNGWYDVTAFVSGTIQIIGSAGISAGAITFEQTNDNTNTTGISLEARELGVINANPTIAAITIAASTRRIWQVAAVCKYVRARISTAFVAGTVQAISQFTQQPYATPVQNLQQAVAANLLTTATPVTPSTHTLQALATVNATSVKATAGNIISLALSNLSAGIKYFKVYAKASAPTVGTDIPIMTIPIAAGAFLALEFGFTGMRVLTGIAYAITGAAADTDTTALAVGDVKVQLTYL